MLRKTFQNFSFRFWTTQRLISKVCLTKELQKPMLKLLIKKLIKSLKDWDNIETRDKERLDSLVTAFADVLTSLRHYIAMMPVTPVAVAETFVPLPHAQNESPGRPCFDISSEMLEEFWGLEFSWTKIGEVLGVSRWTIHSSVSSFG